MAGRAVCSGDTCLAEIHDVDVGAEALVVGEVVAGIVGVFVDDDVVGVPEPAVDEAEVVRRDALVPKDRTAVAVRHDRNDDFFNQLPPSFKKVTLIVLCWGRGQQIPIIAA
jgi:hypothetical protein